MPEGFTLKNEVRKEFPLSPCLFVITVETLPISIRCKSKIKGIIHNGWKRKITQFADDTVLSIVAEDESLSTALTCIDHFKYISGLGINKNKVVRVGSIIYSGTTLLSGR